MIFAAIAVAWLAYLVPHFARRREDKESGMTRTPLIASPNRCALSGMARRPCLIMTWRR